MDSCNGSTQKCHLTVCFLFFFSLFAIKFFSERLYVAQSSSQEQLDIFFDLLQKTLAGEIASLNKSIHTVQNSSETSKNSQKPHSRRHDHPSSIIRGRLTNNVAALGVRCRLVEMCLSLLQNTGFKSNYSGGQGISTDELSSHVGGVMTAATITTGTGGGVGSSGGSVVSAGGRTGGSSGSQGQIDTGCLFPLARIALREKAYATILNYFT